MDKDVHIYNGILVSHKREWNNAIYSNMNVPKDCHTEWSKSNVIWYHLYVESKKCYKEFIYKIETESQT